MNTGDLAAAVRRARLTAAATAIVLLVADQASKAVLIDLFDGMPGRGMEVLPFFNLVMVWNRGVSFGMFGDSALAPWVLVLVSLAIVAGLLIWIRRLEHVWTAIALGGIVGGAVGNVIDRLRYGAVADFFDFHVGGWHWPAFNIADAGIVIGVGMLMLDSIFGKEAKATHERD